MDDLAIAKAVIQEEVSALNKLAEHLDKNFCMAIDIIANTKGKVVVSGIGKSGHVASKIAATLSSTGTASFFIHPSEASHGDIGALQQNDCLLLISNSGETKEMRDICLFAKHHNIPIISIVGNKDSFLALNSNIIIKISIANEAFLFNNIPAPSVSTTCTLVLGDAIAGAVMSRKLFTREQYNKLHPGGKLGQLMSKVKNVKRPISDVPLISINQNIAEAILEMTEKGFGLVGIYENDKRNIIGTISDGDLRRHLNDISLKAKVSEIMTKSPKVIKEDDFVIDAIHYLKQNKIINIFVVDNQNKITGMLQLYDILKI
jgi:arabinose-5-phosphate isomerase